MAVKDVAFYLIILTMVLFSFFSLLFFFIAAIQWEYGDSAEYVSKPF